MFVRIVSIAFTFLILSTSQVLACSCLGGSKFESSFLGAQSVVTASVIKHIGEDKVLVHIDDVWKGAAPKEKEAEFLAGLGSSCGYTRKVQPEIGSKYLIFLGVVFEDFPFRIRLSPCHRNALYEERLDDIAKLREYRGKLEELSNNIKASPKSSEPILNKARFLIDYRDFLAAEVVIQGLLSFDPNNIDALSLMSQLLYQNAKSQYARGGEDEVEIRKSFKRKTYEKALEFANRALEMNGNDQQAINVKVAVSLHLGRKINSDFINLKLTDTEIEYQDFSNIKFKNVDFSNARLFGNKIANTKIEDTSFNDGSILHTKLDGAHVTNVNFDNAYIDKATKKGAEKAIPFEEANFINSTFENSSFVKARVILPIINSKIKNCSFNQASFESGYGDGELIIMDDVTVENSDFRGVRISHNSFKFGTIKNASFKNVDFEGALIKAELLNVDLSGAQLDQASFLGSMFDCETKWPKSYNPIEHGASPIEEQCNGKSFPSHNFDGMKFKRFESFGPVNFKGASFKNADMYGLSLVGANLQGADFTNANIGSADLRKTNLNNAILKNLKIERVNFEEANLENVDFTGSYFAGARLQNTDLSGANFTGADIRYSSKFDGAIYTKDTIWPEGFKPEITGAILVD